MKKLIKNEICGSMNSARMHCSLEKVNICSYCSCTVHWTVAAFLQKRVKTKKKKRKEKKRTKWMKTQLHLNADAISAIQTSTKSLVFKQGGVLALGSSLGGKVVALSSILTSSELAWSRELVVAAWLSLMELKSTLGKFSIASILKSSKPAA